MTYERTYEETPEDRATRRVLNEVATERRRQDAKWGEQNHHAGVWMLILTEEVGEAAKAALEMHEADERAEYIQVAAVAVARVEAIDRRTKP